MGTIMSRDFPNVCLMWNYSLEVWHTLPFRVWCMVQSCGRWAPFHIGRAATTHAKRYIEGSKNSEKIHNKT